MASSTDRLDIFVRGANSALYHKYREGFQWSTSWTWIGGTFVHDPAAISCLPDRVDVFVIGTDSALYSKTRDGSQWLPNPIEYDRHGGEWKSKPCVVSRSQGTMDVFLWGFDDAIWHKPYSTKGGWGPFKSLGGRFSHPPSAVSRGDDNLHVFGVGFDLGVYTKTKGGTGTTWNTDWENLGGMKVSEVKAISWHPIHIELFCIGCDSALWHKWFLNGWANGPSQKGWERMGGRFQGAPEAFGRTGPDIGTVFIRDINCAIQEKSFGNGKWSPRDEDEFHSLGGTVVSNVSAFCVGNRVELFAVNADQEVVHKVRDGCWKPSTTEYESLGSVLALSTVAATYCIKSRTS